MRTVAIDKKTNLPRRNIRISLSNILRLYILGNDKEHLKQLMQKDCEGTTVFREWKGEL